MTQECDSVDSIFERLIFMRKRLRKHGKTKMPEV